LSFGFGRADWRVHRDDGALLVFSTWARTILSASDNLPTFLEIVDDPTLRPAEGLLGCGHVETETDVFRCPSEPRRRVPARAPPSRRRLRRRTAQRRGVGGAQAPDAIRLGAHARAAGEAGARSVERDPRLHRTRSRPSPEGRLRGRAP